MSLTPGPQTDRAQEGSPSGEFFFPPCLPNLSAQAKVNRLGLPLVKCPSCSSERGLGNESVKTVHRSAVIAISVFALLSALTSVSTAGGFMLRLPRLVVTTSVSLSSDLSH